MTDVYIGVGSNIHPDKNIPGALSLLKDKVCVKATSIFYYTLPLGNRNQALYCNGVWKVKTTIDPYALKFEILRPIESSLGRVRGKDTYASRPVDLDILVYGDTIMKTENLVIPDPGVYTRPFVCIPLYEIAPGLIIPDTGKPVKEIVMTMIDKQMKPAYHITHQLKKGLENG
jgi:2-amino-4-hydroxy-6-hydroxymethyldihydropteridine diphosphokinase